MLAIIPALDFMRSICGAYRSHEPAASLRVWSCGYGIAMDLAEGKKTKLVGVIGAHGNGVECFVQMGLPNVMRIASPAGIIELVNEPTYSFGSADNVRTYPRERHLAPGCAISSIHGVLLDGVPIAVFANGGGASSVHDHSAIVVNGLLYFALGDRVVCMSVSPIDVRWSLQVDPATCFGVHHDQAGPMCSPKTSRCEVTASRRSISTIASTASDTTMVELWTAASEEQAVCCRNGARTGNSFALAVLGPPASLDTLDEGGEEALAWVRGLPVWEQCPWATPGTLFKVEYPVVWARFHCEKLQWNQLLTPPPTRKKSRRSRSSASAAPRP
jgi:hypothetical protein